MKSSRIILRAFALVAAAAAVAFASLYFLTEPATSRATVKKSVVAQPCGDRIFGHVTSLARKGDHLELRFDPAWFTSGLTANTAAGEDGAVAPGDPVPNDNYVVEGGHRSLAYVLPATAHVTVLAKGAAPDSSGFPAAVITVSGPSGVSILVRTGSSVAGSTVGFSSHWTRASGFVSTSTPSARSSSSIGRSLRPRPVAKPPSGAVSRLCGRTVTSR